MSTTTWARSLIGQPGSTGPAGATGATGAGVTGATGVTGVAGATGVQGATGAGVTGATGPRGVTGATGVQGATGAGVTGATGVSGATGAQGATGSRGATGVGVTGATGVAGATGAQGATGAGVTGATGVRGATGATGAQGATGAGVTGATGVQGVTGAIGVTGATGIQGPTGPAAPAFGALYSTATTEADPGVELFRLNNTDISLATKMFLSGTLTNEIGSGTIDIADWMAIATGSLIHIRQASANQKNLLVRVDAVTDNTGWFTLDITVIGFQSEFTSWPNTVLFVFNMEPRGATGAVGSTGAIGVTGATGVVGVTGATGVVGVTGATGVVGVSGATGAGVTGATGVVGVSGATGVVGVTGATGVVGVSGATGVVGVSGATGVYGGAITIPYTFSTTTTDADPGAGNLRLDNATQNIATTIRADLLGSDGADWSSALGTVADSSNTVKGHIRLVKRTDPTAYLLFSISALASPAGYKNITVANVSSSAASPFSNGDALLLCFQRAGDVGVTGATGVVGVTGATGVVGVSGATGVVGVTGATGVVGVTGATGVVGVTGATGAVGVTGATGAAVAMPATQSSDVTASGITETKTAGEALVFGDPCYMKSDGKLWKADANGASTYPALYMALATISADASGNFLRRGQVRNDAWAWTIGGVIYLSTSAGLTQTQPSATDDVIQVLGVAFPNADTIQWEPSLDVITHT